jgi:hypothetical protein
MQIRTALVLSVLTAVALGAESSLIALAQFYVMAPRVMGGSSDKMNPTLKFAQDALKKFS